MRVALFSSDGREVLRNYQLAIPELATATHALLEGFAFCADLEVHVISFTQRPVKSPQKLAENIFFHSLLVPRIGWLRTLYQGCIRAGRKKIRELNPDIVHGLGTEREAAISAVFSGLPNVVTMH